MQAGKGLRFIIMSAATMLMMLLCLSHGWAQALLGPYGLALDARGNLYVANFYSDQVLVYDPNYVQQAGKSISGLSFPLGVAFDSKGNVYVANSQGNNGTGSITQYSAAGVLNTRFSITQGINNPTTITIDGLDDLYVANSPPSGAYVSTYPLADTIQGPNLLSTIALSPVPEYGIAVHGGDLYVGTIYAWKKGFVSELLAGVGGFPVVQSTLVGVNALATDSAGHLYVVTGYGEVDFWGPKGGPVVIVPSPGFVPAGIAVDSARGRIYLSNLPGNQVLVYSTKGTLLHTIQ